MYFIHSLHLVVNKKISRLAVQEVCLQNSAIFVDTLQSSDKLSCLSERSFPVRKFLAARFAFHARITEYFCIDRGRHSAFAFHARYIGYLRPTPYAET